jgi:NADH-quinone oxidoreductase subunit M
MFAALLAGIAAVAVLDKRFSRGIAICASALVLALVVMAVAGSFFNISSSGQFYSLIPSLGISLSFDIGIIQQILLLLSSAVVLAALISKLDDAQGKIPPALMLIFDVSAVGLFYTSNLVFFLIFWEIGMIVMFFKINLLGHANRKQASERFLIYSMASSALLLFAILLIYFYTPVHSFDIQYIIQNSSLIHETTQILIFAAMAGAFFIKMPVFPFHLWIKSAYAEASGEGSMLLSGILSKYGAYGMLLLFLMLPAAKGFGVYMLIISAFSAFYAAFLALRQTDLRGLLAYASMAEMGIILVGISSGSLIGSYGAAYAMLAQGLSMALLFLVAGSVEYMFGVRNLSTLHGIVEGSAASSYSFMVGLLAVVGLPMTAGFVGEIMMLIGAYQGFGIPGIVPFASLIIIGASLYLAFSRSFLSTNEVSEPAALLDARQKAGYSLLVCLIFLLGIAPFVMLGFNL